MDKNELTALRSEIDGIDAELIALLERRMDVAARIARHKQENALPVMDEARERAKLASVAAQCRPETAEEIRRIFVSVMAASRAFQQKRMED